MPDEALEERLAAVERAVDAADAAAGEATATPGDRGDLGDRLEALEADVAELEAAVQAVRGYVGSVKQVNDEVERRADAAMAKAEVVERALDDDFAAAGDDGAVTDADRATTDDAAATVGDDATVGDGARSTDERHTRQCPRCGANRGAGSRDDPAGAGEHPPEPRDGRTADGGRPSGVGRREPSPATGRCPGEVGHRRLEEPAASGDGGLLAWLREVL